MILLSAASSDQAWHDMTIFQVYSGRVWDCFDQDFNRITCGCIVCRNCSMQFADSFRPACPCILESTNFLTWLIWDLVLLHSLANGDCWRTLIRCHIYFSCKARSSIISHQVHMLYQQPGISSDYSDMLRLQNIHGVIHVYERDRHCIRIKHHCSISVSCLHRELKHCQARQNSLTCEDCPSTLQDISYGLQVLQEYLQPRSCEGPSIYENDDQWAHFNLSLWSLCATSVLS